MGKNVLYVRLKEKEAAEIYSRIQESGMTINTFVVRSLLKSDPAALAEEQANRKKLEEIFVGIKRMGNNLNQIARRANTKEDVANIRAELQKIMKEAQNIATGGNERGHTQSG